MTRALALTAVAFGAAACGSSHQAVARGCVRVCFERHASRAAETAVTNRLRRNHRVVRLRFVSKQQALREMRKRNPDLFTTIKLPYNPLPDAVRVETVDDRSARVLVRSVSSWRGVELVKRALSVAQRKHLAKATGRSVRASRCL